MSEEGLRVQFGCRERYIFRNRIRKRIVDEQDLTILLGKDKITYVRFLS